jgi:hypothetical protein
VNPCQNQKYWCDLEQPVESSGQTPLLEKKKNKQKNRLTTSPREIPNWDKAEASLRQR